MNTYVYVDSNPLSFYDPTGQGKTGATIGGAIGGTIGGIGGAIVGGGVGAGGGTLVAPGVGTVGGGAAGAVQGAAIGATLLGGIGAIIGSKIEDICKPAEDPCKRPEAVYDLVNDEWKVIGRILYKDIPLGAFIVQPPKTPGSCGTVLASTLHVQGGALGQLLRLPKK